ncbi:hypothetical protein FRC19_010911 [Serendipita sp. 401]|nr:hypothetical protein FRC19_010911 [Serendipita sp. 401]
MSVDECKIVDLAISPNGRKMVCIGAHCSDPKKGRVYLWDLDSFYHVTDYDIEGIISSFSGSCISFSADSTRFATRSDIQSVQLRDAESEKDVTIATLKGCRYVVFSPNGNYLASYSTDFDVTIFDQHSGKIMSRLSGHTACILNISFSPDGTRLASVSADQTVRVWAVPSWQPLGTIFPGYTGDVQYAILSTDWKRFVCASLPCRHLSLYDLQTGDSGDSILGRKIKPRSYITANSPTGPYVARGDNLLSEGKGGIQLWDLATKKAPMIKGSDLNIIGLVFSPDGKLIAAASADSYVRLWKTSSQTSKGEPIHVPILSEGEVDAFFFSPDSNLLGICASGNAQVWDINTGKLIWQHSGAIFAFDPTSKEVVGVDETNVYMSKLDSKPRPLGPRKRSRYIDAAFSLEELLVAVVHESGIEVWLINESWKLQFEIPIPRGSYRRLSFSPDGEYLAYGQLCWKFDVNNEPYLRYSEDAPPESFSNGGPESHSFLTYKDGWIHSAFPPGPLVPIPSQLRDDACWSAYGNSVILWNDFGEPISIDCTPLLQRFKRT